MKQIVITGAPGTGKTALVTELGRSFLTVPEPARRVITEHQEATGETTLDHRPELFVERLVERSVGDLEIAPRDEIVVFDRGLPDCVAYARSFGVDDSQAVAAASQHRYTGPVFILPPWREIFVDDEMRRATFDQTVEFHDHLISAYTDLDYEMIELPLIMVEERAAIVAQAASSGGSRGRR